MTSTCFMYLYMTLNNATRWRMKELALWWSWVVWVLVLEICLTLWSIRELFEALEGVVMVKYPNYYILQSGKCKPTRAEYTGETPTNDEFNLWNWCNNQQSIWLAVTVVSTLVLLSMGTFSRAYYGGQKGFGNAFEELKRRCEGMSSGSITTNRE